MLECPDLGGPEVRFPFYGSEPVMPIEAPPTPDPIATLVASAPPLSESTRARLALLLRGGAR